MGLTQFSAFFGAITSLVALIWNIIRALRNKPKLKINANIGKIPPRFADRDYLFISITNISYRPVEVAIWGGRKKKSVKGKRLIICDSPNLPRFLKEGENYMGYTDDLSILSPELKKICIWDTALREWKVSRKNLKRLFEDLKKLKSSDKE